MSELDDFTAEVSTAEPAEVTESQTETPEQAPEAPEEAQAELELVPEGESEEGSTAEPEAPEKTEKEAPATIPIAALLDEREKRQKGEKALAELQTRLDAATKVDVPTPDVLEDQEGFVAQLQQQMQAVAMNTRTEMSQEMMRMMHDDYDAVEGEFMTLAAENPDLSVKLSQASNPAKFAYETVKNAEKLSQMENVDEYEAKVRAEIETKVRAELVAEFSAEAGDIADKAGALKPSLAGQRAAGNNKPQPVVIQDPLEAGGIFDR